VSEGSDSLTMKFALR